MNVLQAKEGMWIPTRELEGDMQAMGLKLTAEDIYSINNSSLKDAVAFQWQLHGRNGECEGLLLTNHHCGYAKSRAQHRGQRLADE